MVCLQSSLFNIKHPQKQGLSRDLDIFGTIYRMFNIRGMELDIITSYCMQYIPIFCWLYLYSIVFALMFFIEPGFSRFMARSSIRTAGCTGVGPIGTDKSFFLCVC